MEGTVTAEDGGNGNGEDGDNGKKTETQRNGDAQSPLRYTHRKCGRLARAFGARRMSVGAPRGHASSPAKRANQTAALCVPPFLRCSVFLPFPL
jgi:hypothetical protein